MNLRTSLITLTLITACALPVLATAGQADQGDQVDQVPIPIEGNPISLWDVVDLVRDVVNVGIVLASLAVVAMIVYGGFKMATAGNTPADFDKGKLILYQAMWGALAIFAVGLIVNTIVYFADDPTNILN